MARRTILIAAALVLVLTSAIAQGVNTSEAATSGTPNSTVAERAASAPPDTAAAALAKVRTVFAEHCDRCHGGRRPAAGLRLSTEADLAALTEMTGAGRDSVMLVVPGHPEASYLVMKIKGSKRIIGNRMPLGARVLSEEDVAIVEQWIRGLAVPDTTVRPTPSEDEGSNG